MTNDTANELIHSVLDGEAPAGAEADLEVITARSADARRELESMKQVFRELELAKDVDVPPALKDDILRELRKRAAERGSDRVVGFPTGAPAFRRGRMFVAGWAAAAVLAIVVVYPLVRSSVEDSGSGASGAMVARSEEWAEVARASSPTGAITLTVRRKAERIEVETTSRAPGPVRLRWQGASITLEGAASPEAGITLDCRTSGCPKATFRVAPGSPATITGIDPGGETVEVVVP